ncbi:hypothetical protein [Vibrio lentus]|uniref:hypothetical protein n=1 Tax=Vibrio lentus TaxID=136468 RepID=UPI00247AAB7D|nr:hypothetical protein [Vibrio lentus]WGS60771.1 hypothetical protein ISX51_00380 [Vibrio lentus]
MIGFSYLIMNLSRVKVRLSVLLLTCTWLCLVTIPFEGRFNLYIPSIFYEIYKLSIFLFGIPLYHYVKRRGLSYLNRCLMCFLLLNVAVLIAQHTFGVGITKYLGITYDTSFYESRGRPTGLTFNANVVGVIGLFIYIFFDTLVGNYRKYKLLSVIVVVLSTSKASLLCLLLYISFRRLNVKVLLTSSGIALVAIIFMYSSDFYGIATKLDTYLLFVTKITSGSNISAGDVEGRLWGWYIATSLLRDNFFGYGLGTWGDFSSTLNPYVQGHPMYIHTSDSALSHILVEQGIFSLFYFSLLYKFLPACSGRNLFFFIVIFLFVTNFGFAQSLFYLGIWLFYIAGNEVISQGGITNEHSN